MDYTIIIDYGFMVVFTSMGLALGFRYLNKLLFKPKSIKKQDLFSHPFFENLSRWKHRVQYLDVENPIKKLVFSQLLTILINQYEIEILAALRGQKISLRSLAYLAYEKATLHFLDCHSHSKAADYVITRLAAWYRPHAIEWNKYFITVSNSKYMTSLEKLFLELNILVIILDNMVLSAETAMNQINGTLDKLIKEEGGLEAWNSKI